MKLKMIVWFGLLRLLPLYCPAQEVKTVAQCRAYREAWLTSADNETKNLAVRELLTRADQIVNCGKEIDAKPLDPGDTYSEAIGIAIKHTGYATLAAVYYREAFDRAAWFLHKKNLSDQFIAEDEAGRKRTPDEGGHR